jgi:hypothetical protein
LDCKKIRRCCSTQSYQVGSVLAFLKDAAPDRRFEFYKSGSTFHRHTQRKVSRRHDVHQRRRSFVLRRLCNYGRWSRDMQSPLCDQARLSVSALTSASAPRFEPIKNETKNRPLFRWIDAIRRVDDRLTAIPREGKGACGKLARCDAGRGPTVIREL